MSNIIELSPQCFVCKDFSYHKDSEELYLCNALCMQTNDIYEMWDECPYMYKKYLIREESE